MTDIVVFECSEDDIKESKASLVGHSAAFMPSTLSAILLLLVSTDFDSSDHFASSCVLFSANKCLTPAISADPIDAPPALLRGVAGLERLSSSPSAAESKRSSRSSTLWFVFRRRTSWLYTVST